MEISVLKILFVEDDSRKAEEVLDVLKECGISASQVDQAATAVEAAHKLVGTHDLLLLDISMNISKGSLGPMRGGHANLGGMDILEELYLEGRSIRTIIITGFSAFKTSNSLYGDYDQVGLDAIKERALFLLKNDFIGAVSFGQPKWKENFLELLEAISK